MDNYPYIIASLPDLTLDFQKSGFDVSTIREFIFSECSQVDRRMIEWLEFGLDENNLSHHFYRACAKCKEPFIKQYFAFDRLVRDEKVAWLEGRQTTAEFDRKEDLLKVFSIKNIIERERELDRLMWETIDQITVFETLSFSLILSFLTKAKIVSRWAKLDKALGEAMFREFVDQINATHKAAKDRL